MLTSPMKLLIRADSGPTIGSGHVLRTLSLARAWKQLGGQATFVCGPTPAGLVKQLVAERFEVLAAQHDDAGDSDAEHLSDIAATVRPDWIVLDGQRFDDCYLRALKMTGAKILAITDQPVDQRNADLVASQNAAIDIGTQCQQQQDSRRLDGPRFALFKTKKPKASSRKRIVSEARRLLVCFGGDDPENWTLRTLQLLSDLDRKRLVVDCLIGRNYQHIGELASFKKTANMSLRVHQNIDRLAPLMARADFAVTACPASCYEFSRVGVPTIVTSMASCQPPAAYCLDRVGLLTQERAATHQTTGCQVSVEQTINRLLNDPSRRAEMSRLGMRLLDGKGAMRIATRMAAGLFSFRKASLADADSVWRWRNDPEVRSVSFDPAPVSLGDYQAAFKRRLDDANIEMWICEDASKRPIGKVEFEFSSQCPNGVRSAGMDIVIDQSKRGRGLGTALIVDAANRLFQSSSVSNIVAQARASNTAGEKAFRAAGFQPVEPVIVDGTMLVQFRLDRDAQSAAVPRLQKSA